MNKTSSVFQHTIYMPRKIAQSNTSADVDERSQRPIAVNKYRPPIVPLRVNKAELMLEKLQRANPVQNIVARRLPPTEGPPVDPNYALYIELDRLATASVPKQAIQPLKIKSPFTEAMIDKYNQEEERNIREAKRSGNYVDFISPPESMKPELEEPIQTPQQLLDEEQGQLELRTRRLNEYQQTQANIARLNKELIGNPRLRNEPAVIATMENLSRRLDGLQNALRQVDIDLTQIAQYKRDLDAENMRIKKKNAIELKNYEDMYKLLNKTLPIQQMPGETDAEYRDRLIGFKQETSNMADEMEARVYEHKVFQRNLKRLINLPTYQVETLIKKLDGYTIETGKPIRDSGVESLERVFQLNEIWPKVETQFIRTYGKDPIFRNPIETLYDFLVKVLEEPLIQEEEEEEVLVVPEEIQQLTKQELLTGMKRRGAIPQGQVANYNKKPKGELQQLFMKFLQSTGLEQAPRRQNLEEL